jgi:hypothetical protein
VWGLLRLKVQPSWFTSRVGGNPIQFCLNLQREAHRSRSAPRLLGYFTTIPYIVADTNWISGSCFPSNRSLDPCNPPLSGFKPNWIVLQGMRGSPTSATLPTPPRGGSNQVGDNTMDPNPITQGLYQPPGILSLNGSGTLIEWYSHLGLTDPTGHIGGYAIAPI